MLLERRAASFTPPSNSNSLGVPPSTAAAGRPLSGPRPPGTSSGGSLLHCTLRNYVYSTLSIFGLTGPIDSIQTFTKHSLVSSRLVSSNYVRFVCAIV